MNIEDSFTQDNQAESILIRKPLTKDLIKHMLLLDELSRTDDVLQPPCNLECF